MADIKNTISLGIGFTPYSLKWTILLGLGARSVPAGAFTCGYRDFTISFGD